MDSFEADHETYAIVENVCAIFFVDYIYINSHPFNILLKKRQKREFMLTSTKYSQYAFLNV